jgi:hypothetical protein
VTIYNIIGQLVGNVTNYINTLLACNLNQPFYIKKMVDSHSSSETIREDPKVKKITLIKEVQVKKISDHIGVFHRYESDTGFGYYLAGLIEGDGHFSSQNQ